MEKELKKIAFELYHLRMAFTGAEEQGVTEDMEEAIQGAKHYRGMTLTKTDRLAMKQALEAELRKRNPNL